MKKENNNIDEEKRVSDILDISEKYQLFSEKVGNNQNLFKDKKVKQYMANKRVESRISDAVEDLRDSLEGRDKEDQIKMILYLEAMEERKFEPGFIDLPWLILALLVSAVSMIFAGMTLLVSVLNLKPIDYPVVFILMSALVLILFAMFTVSGIKYCRLFERNAEAKEEHIIRKKAIEIVKYMYMGDNEK